MSAWLNGIKSRIRCSDAFSKLIKMDKFQRVSFCVTQKTTKIVLYKLSLTFRGKWGLVFQIKSVEARFAARLWTSGLKWERHSVKIVSKSFWHRGLILLPIWRFWNPKYLRHVSELHDHWKNWIYNDLEDQLKGHWIAAIRESSMTEKTKLFTRHTWDMN